MKPLSAGKLAAFVVAALIACTLLVGCNGDDAKKGQASCVAVSPTQPPADARPSLGDTLPPTQLVDQTTARRPAPTELSSDFVSWVLEQEVPICDRSGNPAQVEFAFIDVETLYDNACWPFEFEGKLVRACADNGNDRIMIYVARQLELKDAAKTIRGAYGKLAEFYRGVESKRLDPPGQIA